jgi:polar amino acid transport system substrate-binding protein
MSWWAIVLAMFALNAVAQDLRIGFGTHRPPYVFEQEDRGLEFEIIAAAARAAGLRLQPYYGPIERAHLMFHRGELDGIVNTNVFEAAAPFRSQPYIRYHSVAMVLSSRGYRIDSIADLGRYSVCSFQRARFLLGDEFKQMADSNPRYFEEVRLDLRSRLLYSGRVEVMVGDPRIWRYYNKYVNQVDASQPVTEYSIFEESIFHLGMNSRELRDRFDQGLAAIRANGEYTKIEQRYAYD